MRHFRPDQLCDERRLLAVTLFSVGISVIPFGKPSLMQRPVAGVRTPYWSRKAALVQDHDIHCRSVYQPLQTKDRRWFHVILFQRPRSGHFTVYRVGFRTDELNHVAAIIGQPIIARTSRPKSFVYLCLYQPNQTCLVAFVREQLQPVSIIDQKINVIRRCSGGIERYARQNLIGVKSVGADNANARLLPMKPKGAQPSPETVLHAKPAEQQPDVPFRQPGFLADPHWPSCLR